MNENQLRTFIKIADKGGFSRAEEELFISKQAMRKQMDTLEQEVGVPLLERLPRGVKLTAAGKVFYSGAKVLLEKRESLIAQCREVHALQNQCREVHERENRQSEDEQPA